MKNIIVKDETWGDLRDIQKQLTLEGSKHVLTMDDTIQTLIREWLK